MGRLTRVLEKSGYTIDLSEFEEPEVVFELVQDNSQEKERSDAPPAAGDGPEQRAAVSIDLPGKFIDAFQILQSKILDPAKRGTVPKSILITSVLPGEGKSFIAANLGVAFVREGGQSCIVVDCDLRHATLAGTFGVKNQNGVSDYLQGEGEVQNLVQNTPVSKLSILASGIPHPDPAELLGSVRMHDLVEELKSDYPDHFLIFDTPALEAVPESLILSHAVDGVVFVVRHGVSSKEAVKRAVLDIGADKILGIIVNGDEADFYEPTFVSTEQYTE